MVPSHVLFDAMGSPGLSGNIANLHFPCKLWTVFPEWSDVSTKGQVHIHDRCQVS